jgi:hypothetical protein
VITIERFAVPRRTCLDPQLVKQFPGKRAVWDKNDRWLPGPILTLTIQVNDQDIVFELSGVKLFFLEEGSNYGFEAFLGRADRIDVDTCHWRKVNLTVLNGQVADCRMIF